MRSSSSFATLMLLVLLTLAANCDKEKLEDILPAEPTALPSGTNYVPGSPQRTGDAAKGYEYLVYGNYIDAGIPYRLFRQVVGAQDGNDLGREGDNADIPYNFTAVDAYNGVRVVAANCLQCHAQQLNGELVVGLGDYKADFTKDQSRLITSVDVAMTLLYGGKSSDEWQAYLPFRRAVLATGPELVLPVRGLNPADKLTAVLAAHRNADDLTWYDEPQMPIPDEMVPTDVPAWWLLKKKNVMFHNGVGRGDFSRIIMASSLLTMQDSTKAREIDENFKHVLAYIKSIEAPLYPGNIDRDKAAKGEEIFNSKCSKCHGTYGETETYPNLMVSLEKIKTDSLLATANYYSKFVDWYNNSWYSKAPFAAKLVPSRGYIAPPLDGIWATAPYLHNGSVPTVEDLLNSKQRPVYFRRNFDEEEYDHSRLGWKFEQVTQPGGTDVYNTLLPGYGNQGHYFGDSLTDKERGEVIEYLKTL